MTFHDFNLHDDLLAGVDAMNYLNATPIQEQAIPKILAGKDLIAHMQLGYVKFDDLKYLVLDEADKMMDMGFADDILNIVRQLPKQRQTLLFSATMPSKIRDFSQQILQDPDEVRLAVSKPAAGINQQFYMTFDHQKLPVLEHLIKAQDVQSMVLFTSKKAAVAGIVRSLNKLGYPAQGISSDRTQEEREDTMRAFKNKQFPILVATDVVSRGIDIDSLSHVVNFDVPRAAEDYVHRIGRTARAATTGTAITEGLGYGPAPEFDPKRFSGLRGKTSPRDGNRGGSGGGR
ncbi:MAG: DEAD/DEAH box helicase, partial [Hymenobacter sp.]